jgi:hypothetical protein
LKTVNSGTIQGKFTEIRSKEEKNKKQKQTTNNKQQQTKRTKAKTSPRTYNLKAAVAGSRLPREGDSIMSEEEEEEEKCKVLKTPATLRSKARDDDYEADLQAAD